MSNDEISWALIETRKVRRGDQLRIGLPERIRDVVVFETAYGDSVYWNYEKHSGYVVIANDELGKPNYEDVKVSQVYDDWSVGLPTELIGEIDDTFREGDTAVFLAYEEMIKDEPSSVFLLSESKAGELLPPDTTGRRVRNRILNTPGFIPPPK